MGKGAKVLPISRARSSGGRPSYVDDSHDEPRENDPGARPPLLAPSTPTEPKWGDWFSGRQEHGTTSEAKDMRSVARSVWRRIVPELEQVGVLSVVDEEILADYCATVAQLRVLTKRMTREGAVGAGSRDGSRAKHPLATVLNQLRGHERALQVQLLLTPAARLSAGFSGGGTPQPGGSNPSTTRGDPFDV